MQADPNGTWKQAMAPNDYPLKKDMCSAAPMSGKS